MFAELRTILLVLAAVQGFALSPGTHDARAVFQPPVGSGVGIVEADKGGFVPAIVRGKSLLFCQRRGDVSGEFRVQGQAHLHEA